MTSDRRMDLNISTTAQSAAHGLCAEESLLWATINALNAGGTG